MMTRYQAAVAIAVLATLMGGGIGILFGLSFLEGAILTLAIYVLAGATSNIL